MLAQAGVITGLEVRTQAAAEQERLSANATDRERVLANTEAQLASLAEKQHIAMLALCEHPRAARPLEVRNFSQIH